MQLRNVGELIQKYDAKDEECKPEVDHSADAKSRKEFGPRKMSSLARDFARNFGAVLHRNVN